MIANLANHLKIHSGLKPHMCDLCGRSFPLKSYLMAHKRRNHSEKKLPKTFSCSVCDYTSRDKKLLEVHKRTHTGERVCNRITSLDTCHIFIGTFIFSSHLSANIAIRTIVRKNFSSVIFGIEF